jgi:hypothetical protein
MRCSRYFDGHRSISLVVKRALTRMPIVYAVLCPIHEATMAWPAATTSARDASVAADDHAELSASISKALPILLGVGPTPGP